MDYATCDDEQLCIRITKAIFKSWEGVQFTLVTESKVTREKIEHVFLLDKDDELLIGAGISSKGKNFVKRDKKAAAEALLRTLHFNTYDDATGACHIQVAGHEMIAEWDGSHLMPGFKSSGA